MEDTTPEEAASFVGRHAGQLIRNGADLCLLYGQHASRDPSRRSEAEILCLAILARAHYTLETILGLQEREVDSIVLTRSLYEHVVTLAWLAIDPDAHHGMFLRWELDQREKMAKDLQRFGSIVPAQINIRRALIGAGKKIAPETADRALEADRYWSRLGLDWDFAFRHTYAALFRPYSGYVHPTVMGLYPFVEQRPDGLKIQAPVAQLGEKVAAHAVLSFADALVVASHRFGWPPLRNVVCIFAFGTDQSRGTRP